MRRSAVLLTLLVPLLSVGCGDVDCEGSYQLGGGFTVEEEANIRTSLQRWTDWSGRPAVLSPEGVCRIERRSVPDPAPDLAKVAEWKGTLGRIDLDVEDIVSTCAFKKDPTLCWQGSFIHELGHSFGLKHLPPGEAGIMSGYDADDYFTPADRRECERVGVCR